jgi:hypothetical protein
MVAFGDDRSSAIRKTILSLRTAVEMEEFFDSFAPMTFYFIMDQFNSIQEGCVEPYQGTPQEFAFRFLRRVQSNRLVCSSPKFHHFLYTQVSSNHVSVFGFSANNHTACFMLNTQRAELDLFVYGGLTEVCLVICFKFFCK